MASCWPAVQSKARVSAGNFTSAWGGLGPYLNSMSLQGSALGGQLPPDLGNRWINVTDFTFSDARMHSSLPPEWGTGFPNLMNMLLQGIPGLYGAELPARSARQATSLQQWISCDMPDTFRAPEPGQLCAATRLPCGHICTHADCVFRAHICTSKQANAMAGPMLL